MSNLPPAAETTPFACTIMTAAPGAGYATKQIIADPVTGKPVKNQARDLGISHGQVQHVELAGLEGLGHLLPLRKSQALIHGVPRGTAPGAMLPLVMEARLGTGRTPAHAIARTLQHFAYTAPHLLMFDIDPDPYQRYAVPDAKALMVKLASIWPVFADVGWLATCSTSSCIVDKATGTMLIPPYGMHVYVLVRGDVPRFAALAKVKLWCADTGYCRLASPNTQTGVAAILERCLTDLSVWSPERLDYVAGADIAAGLPFEQHRPPPVLHRGNVLDLDLLPDATPAEETEYAARVADERARLAPERVAVCTAHLTQAAPELSAAAVAAEVTLRIDRANHAWVAPDHVITLAHGKVKHVLAGELTRQHHGLACADPMEPDYGPNHAKIFWDADQPSWVICSLAHGFKQLYFPEPEAPAAESDEEEADFAAAFAQMDTDPGTDPHGTTPPRRPEIHITTEMTRVIDQAQAALVRLPQAPVVFQRAHLLMNIARGVKPPRWLARSPEAPISQMLKPAWLKELMSLSADWLKFDKTRKKGEEWQPALPPTWVVEGLAARPDWPFPVLAGILSTPTLRPDGSVLDAPGYDPETGLYLDLHGVTFPPLLSHPTKEDAVRAIGLLADILQDFPFVGTSLAAALAALLSLLCRHAVQGNVPLFAVRSTVRGSGKGLLIDTLSTIGTGRPAPHWAQSDTDEEDRKRMLTIGLAGDPCLHIDNLKYPLGSPSLDMALTTSSATDRLLGGNQQITAPLTAVWFASGNNMQFKSDTARRVVPIDLDPQVEKPEERTGFAYPALLAHVRAHRPALAMAALTIVHAYFGAGCPPQGISAYGSFDEWSDLIRSAVVWATDQDPCAGRKDLEAQSDPAYERLHTLLTSWELCYGATYVGIAEAVATCVKTIAREESLERNPPKDGFTPNPEVPKWRDLHLALSNFDTRWNGQGPLNVQAIGQALNAVKDRVIDQKRFEKHPTRSKTGHTWRVFGVADVAGVAVHDLLLKNSSHLGEEKEEGVFLGTRGAKPTPSTPATPAPPSPDRDPQVEWSAAAPPAPVFTTLTLSDAWCATCRTNVTFRTLPLGDGTDIYRCTTCNTKVGSKAPPEVAPPVPPLCQVGDVVYLCHADMRRAVAALVTITGLTSAPDGQVCAQYDVKGIIHAWPLAHCELVQAAPHAPPTPPPLDEEDDLHDLSF